MYSAIAMPPGEVIDRLTILQLKIEHAKSAEKIAQLTFDILQYEAAERRLYLTLKSEIGREHMTRWTIDLRTVNSVLWNVEDALRIQEREQLFDGNFIDLARKVYQTNDDRNRLKSLISGLFDLKDDIKIYKRDETP